MIVLILLIGAGVCLDLYCKQKARTKIEPRSLGNGFFRIGYVKNYGSFRGLLAQHTSVLKVIQGLLLTAVALGLYKAQGTKKDNLLLVGLSLILSGGLGNYISRLKDGFVTDWFAIKWTKNLYYNLADIMIFGGSLVLIIRELIGFGRRMLRG